MRVIAFLVCGLAPAFSQTSHVPYASGSDGPGPTFTNETITDALPGKYSSIHKVDFRNLKPLKNGRYQEHEDDVEYSEELDNIYYLGSGRSSDQAALVLYSWFSAGGSSSQGGIARVFEVVDGTLRSTQKISWDTHFQAGRRFVTFDSATKALVIRSSHYLPGDAHCCVSAMDVVTFRWGGAAFLQVDLKTELSEYGKQEGKQVPH
jgi:hypothetical protein